MRVFAMLAFLVGSCSGSWAVAQGPVEARGGKALGLIEALVNGGIELPQTGHLQVRRLACRGNSGTGAGRDPHDPSFGIGYQRCSLENDQGDEAKALTDSLAIVNALASIGVEQDSAMGGRLFVEVAEIDCAVNAKAEFWIQSGKETIVNPARFHCVVSGF